MKRRAFLERAATVDQVRSVLADQGLGDAEVQTISNDDLGKNVVQISAHELGDNGVRGVTDALRVLLYGLHLSAAWLKA